MIKHSSYVIRIRWPCIFRGMAWIAIGIHELIITIDVARLTGRRDVCAGQDKLRRAVIEG